jgi:poly(3-hydroxybutyrate) depolymerase
MQVASGKYLAKRSRGQIMVELPGLGIPPLFEPAAVGILSKYQDPPLRNRTSMGIEAQSLRSAQSDGSIAQAQAGNGLINDVLDGFGHSFRSHFDGARQAFGANVDLSYLQNENTAQRVGHFIGDASMFIGGSILMKRVPFLSSIAEGRLASVATGGLLGFTNPLGEGESGLNRLYNTGLGAGTMALMEFGPNAIGRIPGVSALPETSWASGLMRYGVSNGLAGGINTEAQSYMMTGHGASTQDLLLGAGTWAALGTVAGVAGSRLQSWNAARAESQAAYRPENAPWQFRNVQNINAAELQPGQQLAPGNYRVSFNSEGAERTANIYVSQAAAQSAERAPVVTHLHGLNPNGQAEEILSELNYFRLADQDGAVVAMLQGRNGLKGLGTFQSFNDVNFGYARPAADVAPYSDQIAFGDMMRIIRNHVPNANTDNIAVSGFSLGGKMANRLAATRSDVAAVASIHGTLDRFDEEIMNAAMNRHPVDGIFVLGTRDKVLPTEGGRSLFTLGLENNNLSRPLRQAEFWGESNGRPTPLTTATDSYTRRDWLSADSNHRVTEYVVNGGAHAIDGAVPRRNLIQWLMGAPKPASYFDARQTTWDFMLNSIARQSASSQRPALVGAMG